VSAFIVQEAVHADWMARYETADQALATIREWVQRGIARPGELNVREIDNDGRTVRVLSVPRERASP